MPAQFLVKEILHPVDLAISYILEHVERPAGLICLSKSVRLLASMVAERYGETISADTGVLDDP